MRHVPDAPLIVLGTQSTMSDVISKFIRAGEGKYEWNSLKAGNVRLGCLEKRTYVTSVSVFTSVSVGRRRLPLYRTVKRWTSCLRFPWGGIGAKTFHVCSFVSYRWFVGFWWKIVSVISYDRSMCYPLSHKSMQCSRLRGLSLELITSLFLWRTTMKNISLSSRY